MFASIFFVWQRSFGFCVNAPKSREKVMDIVRREAERCDRLGGFLICMSLAGGTGSGAGSYYTEALRDTYEKSSIINNCIWPFSTGEVTLQNYNFLLTLNKLYEHSDALILLENDSLQKICKQFSLGGAQHNNKSKLSGSSSALNEAANIHHQRSEITFDDLNELVAHKLLSIFQPSEKSLFSQRMLISNQINQLIVDMCPNVDYKLLSLSNVPLVNKNSIEFSSYKWEGLYRHARQLLINGELIDEGVNCWTSGASTRTSKSLALALFARGLPTQAHEHDILKNSYFGAKYQQEHMCNRKFSFASDNVHLWQNCHLLNKYEKSLALLNNSQAPIFKIETLVAKAWNMYSHKSYIHQYLRYELFEENDFLNSFIFAEQLIKNYLSI